MGCGIIRHDHSVSGVALSYVSDPRICPLGSAISSWRTLGSFSAFSPDGKWNCSIWLFMHSGCDRVCSGAASFGSSFPRYGEVKGFSISSYRVLRCQSSHPRAGSADFRFGSCLLVTLQKAEEPSNVVFILRLATYFVSPTHLSQWFDVTKQPAISGA